MTQMKSSTRNAVAQAALLSDPGFLGSLIEKTLQELINHEFTDHVGADTYERTDQRSDWRNGYYPRTLTQLRQTES